MRKSTELCGNLVLRNYLSVHWFRRKNPKIGMEMLDFDGERAWSHHSTQTLPYDIVDWIGSMFVFAAGVCFAVSFIANSSRHTAFSVSSVLSVSVLAVPMYTVVLLCSVSCAQHASYTYMQYMARSHRTLDSNVNGGDQHMHRMPGFRSQSQCATQLRM